MGILILILTSYLISEGLIKKFEIEVINNANKNDYTLNKSFLNSFIRNYYMDMGFDYNIMKHIVIINCLSSLKILADYKKNQKNYNEDFEKMGIYTKKEMSRNKLIHHLNAILDDIDGKPTKEDLKFIKNFLHIIKSQYNSQKPNENIIALEKRVIELDDEIKTKKKLR